jgi:cell division protein FtsL
MKEFLHALNTRRQQINGQFMKLTKHEQQLYEVITMTSLITKITCINNRMRRLNRGKYTPSLFLDPDSS